MTTITVFESITLDGIMQAPGRPDEDTRGGFAAGGWATPYQDEVAGRFAGERLAAGGALLFGRRTYDDVLGFWTSTPEPNPFTDALVSATKYVVTRQRDIRLAHPNSTALIGEASGTVAALRRELEARHEHITVMGSGELVRTLLAAGLVDELVLLQHPLVLGTGTRLFDGDGVALDLQRAIPTTTGVVIGQYSVR